MRHIVKRLCPVFLAVLLLAMCVAHAAQETEYPATRNFIDYLESKNIEYTYDGLQYEKEVLTVSYPLDHFESLAVKFLFKNDSEEVSLRMWEIVTAKAKKDRVLSVLNKLNDDYKFVKFVYDEDDSTIQAELDMYIDGEHCGRSIYNAMLVIFQVVDNKDVAKELHSLE